MTTINHVEISIAARKIVPQALSRDDFNAPAAIVAQMTEWYGTKRGVKYEDAKSKLTNAVNFGISEAQWRLNVVAGMDVE